MTPIPQLSRDHGKSWVPLDLPPAARVIADRQDPQRLYALDFRTATLRFSEDSGAIFRPLSAVGLPHTLDADEPANPEIPAPLLAVPGRSGDLWLLSQGRLFHSLDGGRRFRAVINDLSIERLGFGKGAKDRDYPALYAIASRGDLRAIWRSDDGGSAWTRINDSHHEYGRRFRCIAGDMRIRGRVYVGTDGRGIVYGDSLLTSPAQPAPNTPVR
jgi:xyloglucan-specific exo-beta-1,4-glucanase